MVSRSLSAQPGGASSASHFSTRPSMMVTELPVCVIINSRVAQGGNFSLVSTRSPDFRPSSSRSPAGCAAINVLCHLKKNIYFYFKHKLALNFNWFSSICLLMLNRDRR